MRCIDSGISDQEIVRRFKGDEQLVNIWIMFLRGNHWLEPDKNGKLVMTDKAKEWLVDHPR
jgi:hypothetical protein